MRFLIASVAMSLLSGSAAIAADVFGGKSYSLLSGAPAKELLPDADPETVFPIGQIIFHYPITLERKNNLQVSDLSKLKSVADAVKAATPDAALVALAGQQLGHPHMFRFRSATVLDQGDAGLEWNVDYELFPNPGGFSGVPFRYRAVLDGHGNLIRPHVIVFDAYLHSNKDGWTCSHLDLSTRPTGKDGAVAPDKIRNLATASLEKETNAATRRMAYDSSENVRIPVATDASGTIVEADIWAVNFRDPSRNELPTEVFTIWVAADGRTANVVHLDAGFN